MTERWEPIAGTSGLYSVSDLGHIRNERRNRFLIGTLVGNGYRAVELCGVRRYIHEIVLTTFVGPRQSGTEGCHNNGVMTDNRATNLRWDTRKNNHADKKRHGTQSRGENHGTSKLTEKAVLEIRRLVSAGAVQRSLCPKFAVSPMTISRIVRRELWTHLP